MADGIRGMGSKSPRSQALDLRRKGFSYEDIARELNADIPTVRNWINGPPRQSSQKRRPAISEASPAQREKVKDRACIVCRSPGPCHPMHLVDRSIGGDDDPRAVVPGCPGCHRAYDEGKLSLLEHLEPHYREELAYAVECVGLISALQRISNERWVTEASAKAIAIAEVERAMAA